MTADLYSDYVSFKRWDGDAGRMTDEDAASLLAFSAKSAPYRLLDIGFGRGEVLDVAKRQGVETYGVEIIPELVIRARAAGHHASEDIATIRGSFDVITACDVLEHLTLDQLQGMLAKVRQLLASDGVFVARFPNGASPFSGHSQNGDMTHVRYLTPNQLRQVAEPIGLRIRGAYNQRPRVRGLSGLRRRAVYLVRDLIEAVIGYAYLGYRVPMDANVVVVLEAV